MSGLQGKFQDISKLLLVIPGVNQLYISDVRRIYSKHRLCPMSDAGIQGNLTTNLPC